MIMENLEEEIVIVGAGIAGLSIALGLHRMGVRSVVLESARQTRVTGFSFLAWMNAWKAFDALGVGDKLRRQHMQLDGMCAYTAASGMPAATTQLSFRTPGKHGTHEAWCVRRKLVVEALADELPRGSVRYSSKVVLIEQEGGVKMVHLADGAIIKARIVIGCDGVNSVVAKWLDLPKPVFTGRVAIRGLADYPHAHAFPPRFLQYFGDGFRSGFLPIDQNTIYWFFVFTPPAHVEENIKADPTNAKKLVMRKLASVPNQVLEVVERTRTEVIFSSPLKVRLPWDVVRKKLFKNNVCVAGDALHPMTPDLAQGGCSALEDGVTLARCLGEALLRGKRSQLGGDKKEEEEEYDSRIAKGIEKYVEARKWRLFNLITSSYLVGAMQQSSGLVMNFLRDWCLARMLAGLFLKYSDFDCGGLFNP